jgi:hypothetical protein
VPGRIAKIQKQQSKTIPKESVLYFGDPEPSPRSTGTVAMSPSSLQDVSALHRISTMSSDGVVMADSYDPHASSSLALWTQDQDSAQFSHPDHELVTSVPNGPTNMESMSALPQHMDTPDFLLPSLPIDSPPDDSFNLFATIPEQDLPPIVESVEFWPKSISQEALLPWIDVYFKRLHPTVPVLNRTMVYQEMLLRTHHHDPQFGAMLLGLCAFAMTQPVQIHEVASTPSRSVQARMLLEESIKMRMTVDFGENPSVSLAFSGMDCTRPRIID